MTTIITVAKEMPAGWYAKSAMALAEVTGPHATKRAAMVALRASGVDVVIQGCVVHRHDGIKLMVVHERY